MKKLTFYVLTFFFYLNTYAQDTPNEFADRHNFIFQHINRTEATTGILLDYGIEFQNMANFNGTSLLDSNYVSISDWRSIYASLLISRYNTSITFTSPVTLNNRIATYIGETLPMPFVVLHYNYNTLRDDALTAGLLTASNDQLYDVANRTQSPYLQKTAFAIASGQNYYKALNGYAEFVFRDSLCFGNTGKTIASIKVDFGNGSGWQTLTMNVLKAVSYSATGYKELKYEITYTDSTILTGHSQIYIDLQQEDEAPGGGESKGMFYTRIGDARVNASTAEGTKYATLQIALSQQNISGQIKKPLIVVEGIDFWKILSPNAPDENTDIDDFLNGSLVRGRLFPNGNLRDRLDSTGYDIVYLDFDEATDDLVYNTELVKAAINWVNSHKNGTEQNVVMGLSMGAVLARNALKQMELASVAHNTRLYVSVDGPHQGANIPLGLQAMVKHLAEADLNIPLGDIIGGVTVFKFADMFPELNIAKNVLQTRAAQQLLKYQMISSLINSSIHNDFFTAYQSQGYPTQCRNIAISNGFECGTPQPFAPNSVIFNRTSSTKIPYVFDAATSWIQAFAIFTNRPLLGLYAPLAIISTKSSFEIEFDVRALPNQSADRIYKGKVGIKRKILFLINVNANIINRSIYSNSSILPYDNAPGGEINFFNNNIGIPATFANQFQVPSFSFISTASSLDIGSSSAAVNYSRLNSGYNRDSPPASPYNSPFNNFVTSVTGNEDHVTFTSRNGDFLLKELAGTTTGFASCAIFCNPTSSFAITGPVVSGGNTTYSISGVPTGTSIQWSVTGGYTIIGSSTGSTVQIQLPAYTTTFAELVATLNSNCGQFHIVKTLVPPVITTALSGGNGNVCGEGTATINVPSGANFVWTATGDLNIEGQGQSYATTSNTINVTGLNGLLTCTFLSFNNTVTTNKEYAPYSRTINVAANPMVNSDPLSASIVDVDYNYNSIKWYVDGILISTGNEQLFQTNQPDCGDHVLSAEVVLSCGATVLVGSVEIERYCSSWRNMVIYPNPAIGVNLMVSPNESKLAKISAEEKSQMKEYEYWLYDSKSKLILKGRSNDMKVELETRKLPSATYFLHLKMDGDKEVFKKQVMIRN